MKYFYDTLPLHDLGEVTVAQTREYEGGDAPQRAKVTLKLQLATFQRTYADNYDLLQRFLTALKKQQAVFQWLNEDTQQYYVNRPVTLVSSEVPDEWGTYSAELNVIVFFFEHDLATQNLPCLFSLTHGGKKLSLGHVLKFGEAATVERFSKLRAHRQTAVSKVTVSGLILGDTAAPLATRRTALTSQAAEYRKYMNQASGVLSVGTSGAVFNQTVRVEEFNFEIDQLINAIAYSFTATYTLFPTESAYATVEFTVEQRDAMAGEQFLALAGKVSAPDEAAAQLKLTELVTALLTEYGYSTGSQQLRYDTTANRVSANGDGETFLELPFSCEWRRWRGDNREMTYRKTQEGTGGTGVSFGHVLKFNFRYAASRFNEQRSQRQRAGGVLEASGTWAADPAKNQADRRTELDAAYQAMLAEVNSPDGTLTFAALPGGVQTVRLDSFNAEINQSITGVDWTMTCSFSLFPNEGNYATAEFSAETREAIEEGESFLTFAGRIQATDKGTALAKLTALRTSVLTLYGFTSAQLIRPQQSFSYVNANGDKTGGVFNGTTPVVLEDADGTTFIELSFTEEYRKPRTTLAWTLQRSDRDDVTTGLVQTTFSGTVTGGGATVDTAYAAALAQAVALGAGKEAVIAGGPLGGTAAFLRSSQISFEKRQVTSAEEPLRLTFSYEYQSKMGKGRAYLEFTTQTARDAFGLDTENVSGFVVAADARAAETAYHEQVRDAYDGRLIRNEATSIARVRVEQGSAFGRQELRLDFSFTAHVFKPSGRVTYRYGIAVTRDFLTLERTVTVRGSVFAPTAETAETAANGLLKTLVTALGLGSPVRDSSAQDMEYDPSVLAGGDTAPGVFIKWDFEATYQTSLAGEAGLFEMKVAEEVQYSGTRWVPQPIPFNDDGTGGVTIVQPTGVQEGMRTVRGTVTAGTLAAAEAWAVKQRHFLTGPYYLPERWERDFDFVPRVEGVAHAPQVTADNVKLYRVGFTFAEILPNHPAPGDTAFLGDTSMLPTTLTPNSTTIIGPPIEGAWVTFEIWVDKLCAVFRCVTSGTSGDWIQEKAAIVPDTSFTGTIPVNYLIQIPGDNWAEYRWDGAAWQAVNLQP